VHSVVLSPDGRYLASGGRDGLVKLWNVESGELLETFQGHKGDPGIVFAVAFSPDARLLATCADDKLVKIWDVASGERIKTIEPTVVFSPSTVCFTGDGNKLLCAGNDAELFDVKSGQLVHTFTGHIDRLQTLTLSHNSRWLATSGANQDGTIRCWEVESGKNLWTVNCDHQEGGDWCLSFSADDRVLISGTHDGEIRYWDAMSGKRLHTVQAHPDEVVSAVAGDASGHFVASASWDGSIKLWTLPTFAEAAK